MVYFGEHLLAQHPDCPVAIVESEKTAPTADIADYFVSKSQSIPKP